MIPFYFLEVKKGINDFYDKKLRELNIPYETEQQIETKTREQIANNLVENTMKSHRWNEESFERKYSTVEVAKSLIYYFFASFFPGYIDKQLDIFQREQKLLQSKKRIRDRKREIEEERLKAEEEKQKAKKEIEKEEEDKISEQLNAASKADAQDIIEESDQDNPIIRDEI